LGSTQTLAMRVSVRRELALKARWIAYAASLLAGCLSPIDYTGKSCNPDAGDPCPAGWICYSGRCQSGDAGSPLEVDAGADAGSDAASPMDSGSDSGSVADGGPDAGKADGGPDAGAPCLAAGDETTINAVLTDAGSQAVLCPNAVFLLDNPVTFTAPGQEIYTSGLPTDSTRAVLRIRSSSLLNAVTGNDQSNITLQNVQVDGNRRQLGVPDASTAALIEMGGKCSNQTVHNVAAYDTRGWSTLHFGEGPLDGGVPSCQSATVTGNTFGPAGTSTVGAVGNWADGISLACGNSNVQNNLIIDATDGAIVIFGAPGSLIQNNTIVTTGQTNLLGGINMVDFLPVEGNFNGVFVNSNIVAALGGFLEVGVAMGPGVWNCPGRGVNNCDGGLCLNAGGTVTSNTLVGGNFGYGFAVNGVMGWAVARNTSLAWHSGTPPANCGATATAPQPFLIETQNSSGAFEVGFDAGILDDIVGVTPPTPSPTWVLWVPPTCTDGVFSGCAAQGNAACGDYGTPGFLGEFGSSLGPLVYSDWEQGLHKVCSDACHLSNVNNWCSWSPPSCTGGTFTGCNTGTNPTCSDPGNASYSNWNAESGALCAAACRSANPDMWCAWKPPTCSSGTFIGCDSGGGTCTDVGSAAYTNWTSDLGSQCTAACGLLHPNAYCVWIPPACIGQTFVGCRIQGTIICSNQSGGSQFPNWTQASATACASICSRSSPDTYCSTGS
jgi:hypothetical protein